MRLVCDVGLDDIIAFNQFYQSHSALGDRVRRTQRVIVLVFLCILLGLGWQFLREDFLVLAIVVAVAGLAALVQVGRKTSLSAQVAKNVRLIYDDPAMKATLGTKAIELDGEWIVQTSEIFQIRARISSLHAIDVEAGRVFIRANPVSAIVIPWNKVSEGDAAAFLDQLRVRCPERLREAFGQGGSVLPNSDNPYRTGGR